MKEERFNFSLLISFIIHLCIGAIFTLIVFKSPEAVPSFIEISVVTLEEAVPPKKIEVVKKILPPPKIKAKVKKFGVKKFAEKFKRPKKGGSLLPKPVKESPYVPPQPDLPQDVQKITGISPPPSEIKTDVTGGDTKIKIEPKDELRNSKQPSMPHDKKETRQVPASPVDGIQTTKGSEGSPNSSPRTDVGPTKGTGDDDKAPFEEGPYTTITGPVAYRKALYKPIFKLPEWLQKQGVRPGRIKIKFWVLPDGSVDSTSIIESSGYSEIDRLANSAILQWKFQRLSTSASIVEWGVITILIKMRG